MPATDQSPAVPRQRSAAAHAFALLRTAIYRVAATASFVTIAVLSLPVMLFPPDRVRGVLFIWASADLFLLRVIVGQRTAVLGRENIPTGAALVAAKHQAAWETIALVPLLPRGTIVLKKELLSIPLYGRFARFFGMIVVDRDAGLSALKKLADDAARALKGDVQIVIFAEGTRRPLGAPPDYKPGAIFLYERLKVPMVPVALNSGVLWPHGKFVRYPGTVTVSFLPAIAPGRPRAEVRAALERAIETETERLVALDGRPPQAQAASG